MGQNSHRILIVGAGSIGERHLRCFLATGRVEAGFVETRVELAEQIARRYPASRAYSSLESALERKWDAAVIATPAPMHISQSRLLLERNISLLIEKPLSVDLTDVEQLQLLSRERSAVIAIAYVHRSNPVLTDMRAALLSGRFGRPVQFIASTGHHFPTARPAYAEIYYAQRRLGGGAVHDAMTHIINAGEWLLGPIDRVVADVDHLVLPRVEVEDTVHVIARHGRIMATYALNQYQAPTEITLTVVCERGTLRFESHYTRWRMMESPDSEWIDSPPVTLERDTLFTLQANAFLDAVEGQSQPLCTLDEGVSTLRVNLAILDSAEAQAWRTTSCQDPS